MQVTAAMLEGDVYEITINLPDTVDTSAWTRNDWQALGYAMARARFDDRDDLVRLVGEVDVRDRHLEGDSELQAVEVDDTIVFDSYDPQRNIRRALETVRTWCAQQPHCGDVLNVIDKALFGGCE